jgi:hypothetical protein
MCRMRIFSDRVSQMQMMVDDIILQSEGECCLPASIWLDCMWISEAQTVTSRCLFPHASIGGLRPHRLTITEHLNMEWNHEC